MARVEIPEGAGKQSSRLWSVAPTLAEGVAAMSGAVYERSSLPVREREVARMRIAQINDCHI